MDTTTSLDDAYSQSKTEEVPKRILGFTGASLIFFVSGLFVFVSSLTQYQFTPDLFVGGATDPAAVQTVGYTFASDPTFLSVPTAFMLVGISLMTLGIVSMYATENWIPSDSA